MPYKKESKFPNKTQKGIDKRKKPEVINNEEIQKHKSQGVNRGIE